MFDHIDKTNLKIKTNFQSIKNPIQLVRQKQKVITKIEINKKLRRYFMK